MIAMLRALAFAALLDLDLQERHQFWMLLVDGRYGWTARETAAFVVRGADGLRLAMWPKSDELHMAKWKGAIPPGAIAIVHTHANHDADPSANDVRTAARVRLPVYVITRTRITVTNGEAVYTVARGRWER